MRRNLKGKWLTLVMAAGFVGVWRWEGHFGNWTTVALAFGVATSICVEPFIPVVVQEWRRRKRESERHNNGCT